MPRGVEGGAIDMETRKRRWIVPAALAAGLVAGGILAGTLTAGAQTGSGSGSGSGSSGSSGGTEATSDDRGPGAGETPLTGETAQRVRAAVLAELPNATIERLETDADGVYEAHVITGNGERAVVKVNADFEVTEVTTCPGGPGRHGPGDGSEDGSGDGSADDGSDTTTATVA
jgi:hypothetical protein